MSEQPPPYRPFFPEGPPTSGFPPAFYSQPSVFPGSAYQTFPQTFTGGDPAYYNPGNVGHAVMQPGYRGDKFEPPHRPKQTVYVMEPGTRGGSGGGILGGIGSYLAPCSAALCCCCLWDMFGR
ncbi:cysteine-rich and transmembrane domain-containing protein 1-like [Cololabis saira]|uniref:cysteine-rich and transmembrane domain-containing protein 1-like n=1 Tax=Cololabis saira TaxID=129043 RepID=UPI002AD35206|nr:cysteine-rich and transmembrane domain-containing protein 1-like [Cololabis saira]